MDDPADPGAAPAAAAEGSLPPRKRLLLKSGSANPSSEGTPIPPSSGHKMDSSPPLDSPAAPDASASAAAAAATTGDSCSRCGSKDNSIWRRVKKGGVYQRLCNTCTMLYSMNMYCPYCLVVYQDAQLGDPQLWLNCAHCKRSVHVACEAKNSGPAVDPAGYTCPECRKPGKPEESTTTPAATTNTSGSPTLKKPRLMKPDGGEPVEGDNNNNNNPEAKPGGVPPTPKSSAAAAAHEALQAAKTAAMQASKAAAQAKATALAKAQAAAKAAMAAKAALDAAAQAARDEIEARAELRRNGVRLEPRGYHALAAAAKLDGAGGGAGGAADGKGKEESGPGDEELARQLHRAMNSSPRNPRGGGAPAPGNLRGSPGASGSEAKEKEENLLEAGAVDTQGFPSTYLTDGGSSFPFDILAGFPSHEIQAGVIPGVTGVVGSGGAMEVDEENKDGDEKKTTEVGSLGMPPGVPEELGGGDKGDTDVSFFGAPDPKFEIPGKWSEDEKQQQIAVDDYTMAEATEEAPAPVLAPGDEEIKEPVTGEGINKDLMATEELQGTQTAIASEAPDAEMKMNPVAEKELTV